MHSLWLARYVRNFHDLHYNYNSIRWLLPQLMLGNASRDHDYMRQGKARQDRVRQGMAWHGTTHNHDLNLLSRIYHRTHFIWSCFNIFNISIYCSLSFKEKFILLCDICTMRFKIRYESKWEQIEEEKNTTKTKNKVINSVLKYSEWWYSVRWFESVKLLNQIINRDYIHACIIGLINQIV